MKTDIWDTWKKLLWMDHRMMNPDRVNNLIYSLGFFILIILMGCSDSSKPDPLLNEAFRIHKQSLQVAKESRALLNKLPADDAARIKIESRLKSWNENLIEVPGFEHDHSHDHHDHHSHGPQVELTPENMLAVQKVLLDSVLTIRAQLKTLHLEN